MVILVCEIARSPAISIAMPPRKWRMLTPFSIPSRLALIGDGNRVRAHVELGHPQLFPGLRIERPEALVVSRADENQSAGGGYRSAHVQAPGVALAFGQLVCHAQRHLPREFSGVGVH